MSKYAIYVLLLLIYVPAAYAQPGPFAYVSFYLVDDGTLINANDPNYAITLSRSDTQDLGRKAFQTERITKSLAYNSDAAWGHRSWGMAAFPQFSVTIVKKQKSKMTILIDVPRSTPELIKHYRINFSEGNYRFTDSSLATAACKVIGDDMTKESQISLSMDYDRTLLHAARSYFNNGDYEKAIAIYQDVQDCSADSLLRIKIEEAYTKLWAKNNYRLYVDQISYGDEEMRKKRYDQALYFYSQAKKMGGDRDKYINRQLSIIQKANRMQTKKQHPTN